MGICRAVRWARNNPYSIGMFRHFLFDPTLQLTAITRRLNLDSEEFKREGHLKMYLRVTFAFISGLFHLFFFFLSKYVPTTLESNLGERFGERKKKIVATCARLLHNCKTGNFTS